MKQGKRKRETRLDEMRGQKIKCISKDVMRKEEMKRKRKLKKEDRIGD